MKKLYLILIAFTICISKINAQIVNIPDANFKAKLIYLGVDTNLNGEIEISETALITGLWIDDSNISSLEGIAAFTNLTYLHCSNNLLTSLDISPLVNLRGLYCSGNSLTSLVLSPGIQELDCSNNQLTTIDLMVLTDLKGLYVANNHLTSLVLPESNLEWELDISGNEYTSIDLSPVHNYLGTCSFYCFDTKLTSLTMTDFFYDTIIENNQFLSSLDLKNGYVDPCVPDPGDFCITVFSARNNPNLQFVCIDDIGTETAYFQDYDFESSANVLVSSYCDFTPGGSYNVISGTTTLDCGGGNITVSNQNINIVGWNNSNIGHTYSNADGAFTFFTGLFNHTVSLQLDYPAYFTVTPTSYTYGFSTLNNTETANFCISPNGLHPDLELVILPLTTARPGFDARYKLVITNKGTEIQSGTLALSFADVILDYINAIPAIAAQSDGLLTWDFTNLAPFEDKVIEFTLNVNSPLETPAVNNGDILTYSASLNTTQTDETPVDNQTQYNQTVVGSFDPNDKIVLEGSQVNVSNIGEYLNYMVRFQNMGTAAAENVVVKDVLSNKYDMSTLQMVSSSHPYRSVLTEGNKLEVIFENINLPPSSVDEPASHGYIAFKIKPKPTTIEGDVIENTANIYFDYNYPVVTNTVSTTFAELGISNYQGRLFKVYPNPTSGILNIAVSDLQPILKITVNNLLGQQIMSFESTNQIDVSTLAKGTYLITVETDAGKETQRIIKH